MDLLMWVKLLGPSIAQFDYNATKTLGYESTPGQPGTTNIANLFQVVNQMTVPEFDEPTAFDEEEWEAGGGWGGSWGRKE